MSEPLKTFPWLECEEMRTNTPSLLMGLQTCTTTMKISVVVPRKPGMDLSQDQTMSLLDVYPKESMAYYRDTRSTVLNALLLKTVGTRKHPRCPSTQDY